MRGEVWRRSRLLVAWILGRTWDEEVSLPVLVDEALEELLDEHGRPKWSAKTIENTVRDLVAFGALSKTKRGRDQVLAATILGKAWNVGVVLPPIRGESEEGLSLEESLLELEGEDLDS